MAATRIEGALLRRSIGAAEFELRQWAPLSLTLVTAGAASVSIAALQIALGAGLAALIVLRIPLRFPPIGAPLALFVALTAISIASSPDPAAGLPQLRKFYAFGVVLLVCSTIRTEGRVKLLLAAACATATASALAALDQSRVRWQEAIDFQAPRYDYILDGRVTGFLGHWMTFAGVQMIILLLLLSFLVSGASSAWKLAGWACAAIIWTALVLNLTRSVFLFGVPVGVVVLAWGTRRRRFWFASIVLLAALLLASPSPIRERVASILEPHGAVDSNSRRLIMAKTGWRMIAANPLLGVGPEQVGVQFDDYVPGDVRRPLPKGWYGHVHNLYLQYGAERGLPALACFLWLIVRIARDMVTALRQTSRGAWVFRGVLAVTAAVLAEAFFEYNLGDSEVLTLYLAIVACGYALAPPDDNQLVRQEAQIP